MDERTRTVAPADRKEDAVQQGVIDGQAGAGGHGPDPQAEQPVPDERPTPRSVAVWFGELDEPHTEGQRLVRALDPELVWLAHEHEPWRPRTV